MELQYHTLTHISLADIAATFDHAFANYKVPLSITPERLADKIRTEGIDLDLSVGVFDGTKMVGFVWHSIKELNGESLIYNGGTGVIPDYRGKRLVQGMYRFIQPSLASRNVAGCVLEAITDNTPAVKTYERLGFGVKRTLNVYKGSPEGAPTHGIKSLAALDFLDVDKFWDCEPSWQHATYAIELAIEENVIVGIEVEGEIVAYAVYYPVISRLKQLAVRKDYRRQGMATSLLQYLRQQYGELTLANIDSSCLSINAFLVSLNMNNYTQQYEMWKQGVDF